MVDYQLALFRTSRLRLASLQSRYFSTQNERWADGYRKQ